MDDAMRKALSAAKGAAETIVSCPKNRDEEIAKIITDRASGKSDLWYDREYRLHNSVSDQIATEFKVNDPAAVIKAAQEISRDPEYLKLVAQSAQAGGKLSEYIRDRAEALGVKGERGDPKPTFRTHEYYNNDLEHVVDALRMTNPDSAARVDRVREEGCPRFY